MCIRDSHGLPPAVQQGRGGRHRLFPQARSQRAGHAEPDACLLYTSDAADERSSVDLGGRRIIKKKRHETIELQSTYDATTREQRAVI